MKERMLLGIVESTLWTIKNQDFKSIQHKEKTERVHKRTTIKLLEMGLGEKVMRLRFAANARPDEDLNFVPTIAERLPVAKSIVGPIAGKDSAYSPVERELLGRIFVEAKGHSVVCFEYLRPQGDQDPLLFEVADKHQGITGIEGVVERTIPTYQARSLLFTGCKSDIGTQGATVRKEELARVA